MPNYLTPAMKEIRSAEDVEAIRQAVEDLAEGFITQEGPIDWHAFLDRLEQYEDIDLGSDMGSPAIRRIQTIVRTVLREKE